MPVDPLATLATSAIDDPRVKSAVVDLALRVIEEADDIMTRGMPARKDQVIRSLLPLLARGLSDVGDEKAKEMHDKLEGLFEAARTAAPGETT